jgi:NAD(P)H dehydrogenase (quinone)
MFGSPLARLLGGLVVLWTFGCSAEPEAASGERIIVSGASGQLGGMVVEELLARGVDPSELILVSRTPEQLMEYERMGASTRFGDFGVPESLPAAYEGGTRMLLISINPVPDRVQFHHNAIDAAVEAGVRHIVYVSSVDVENPTSASAFDHRSTEEYIRASGVEWTMVRNHLYANGLVNQAARMVADRSLLFQPDEVPTAFVAREDCAAAAAAVLAGEGHEGMSYDITGPDLVLRSDIADMASELTGVTIERIEGPGGVPQATGPMAGFASFDLRSDAVQELTGRPPISVRQLLEENVEVLREAAGTASASGSTP